MTKKSSIFEKYPKTATVVLSAIIVGFTLFLLALILQTKIFQDYKGGEKYSISDKIKYSLRCNNSRHIILRENPPNSTQILTSEEKFATLEDKDYILKTDQNGFIKPSFVHENPDLQIIFVGGSTTQCSFVDEEFRFPYLVGKNLEKLTGLKINSDNAAREGNNSFHSINIIVNKVLPKNPDIIVMMENINDLSTLIYEGDYFNDNKNRAILGCVYKNNKSLNKKDEWANSDGQKRVIESKEEQEKLVAKFRDNLEMFIYIAKSQNVIPVLMTQANRIEDIPDFTTDRGAEFDKVYRDLYKKFNQTIREVGKENKVLVIDLAKYIPQDPKYIYDKVHMNKEGSIMASDRITEEIFLHLKRINFKKNSEK